MAVRSRATLRVTPVPRCLFVNDEGLPVQCFGFRILALILFEQCQPAQSCRHQRMFRSQRLLTNREGAQVGWLRVLIPQLGVIQAGQAVQNFGHFFAFGAERLFVNGQRAAVSGFRQRVLFSHR